MKWKTEKRKISELKECEYNPRQLTKKQYKDLKSSLDKFGLCEIPVINTDNTIIAGHQRIKILKEKSADAEIEVRVPSKKLNKEQFDEYLIRSNKNTGEWDWDTLANSFDMDVLYEYGFEPIDFGFDVTNLEPEETKGDDDVPEVKSKAITVKGDLYELGEHRLLCGDSTMIDDVEKLMDGGKADMVYTDPPYGMNAVSNSGVLSKNYKSDILNDDSVNVAKNCFNLCLSLNINKMVFWGANYYSSSLPDSSCWLVWDKNNGQSDQMDCELAWTNLKGCTRQYTQASEKTNRVHPTQKPVSLAEWCFAKYDANTVIDLFLGSGSTLIACEKTNRKCYGMELDEKYCDVIVKRYIDFCMTNNRPFSVKRNGKEIGDFK